MVLGRLAGCKQLVVFCAAHNTEQCLDSNEHLDVSPQYREIARAPGKAVAHQTIKRVTSRGMNATHLGFSPSSPPSPVCPSIMLSMQYS